MADDKIKQELRQIFEIYSCDIKLSALLQRIRDNKLPLKDAAVIIADCDGKIGQALSKLMLSKISIDEMFYEGQPFIICGLTKRSTINYFIKKMNRKICDKLKSIKTFPVIVAYNDTIDVFALAR